MTPDAEDAAPYCVDYCHGMVGGPAVIGPTGIIGFMQGPENDRKAEELCKRLNAAWKELGPTIIFLRKKREDAEQAIDAATKPLREQEGRLRLLLAKTEGDLMDSEARNKALVEALKIPHSSAPEDLDDEVCCRCGGPYNTRPGCDASPECDPCAQEVLALARAALAANEERGK